MAGKRKNLKILAIQMSSVLGDKWANFSKVADLVEKNFKKSTDIIVLPEFWNTGFKPDLFEKFAEDLENSETIEFLSELAIRYNVNIIGGSFIVRKQGTGNREQKNNFSLYNTCPIINRNGKLVATYDKMHLFSYYGCKEGEYITKGENPVLVDIDGIKIGLTICYDIRFPEIYRAYRKAGADLLIDMAAWPKSRPVHWEVLSAARAIENQCFMVALTQSGLIEGDEYNLGHSRIIDYNGEVIAEIGGEASTPHPNFYGSQARLELLPLPQGARGNVGIEGAMFAEIKFDEMYKFREKCTVLNDIHKNYKINNL